jgi:hypothetical protein
MNSAEVASTEAILLRELHAQRSLGRANTFRCLSSTGDDIRKGARRIDQNDTERAHCASLQAPSQMVSVIGIHMATAITPPPASLTQTRFNDDRGDSAG